MPHPESPEPAFTQVVLQTSRRVWGIASSLLTLHSIDYGHVPYPESSEASFHPGWLSDEPAGSGPARIASSLFALHSVDFLSPQKPAFHPGCLADEPAGSGARKIASSLLTIHSIDYGHVPYPESSEASFHPGWILDETDRNPLNHPGCHPDCELAGSGPGIISSLVALHDADFSHPEFLKPDFFQVVIQQMSPHGLGQASPFPCLHYIV